MRTVLVVEEERPLRALMVLFLKREGCTVMEARSAADALELWATQADQVELLISDVRMNGMDGLRLARILTTQKPQLKVIFCSGGDDAAVHRLLASNPEWGFLAKPFSPKDFRKILFQVLDGPASVEG
jgi:CheY-like chemotaxis protein